MRRLTRIAANAALLLMLCIGTAACNNDSCYDNGNSLPLATFYVGDNQQNITGLTVMGIGAPGDSLLLDSASVNELFLPLRATTTSSSFLFQRWRRTADTDPVLCRDTLTIDYEPIEYFHSIECGAMFNFDVKRLNCTSHGIDSVVLLTRLFTNSRTPAVRIHFAQ